MVTFSEIVRQIDGFMVDWGGQASARDPVKMRVDLLNLIEKAVDYGEQKDRSKVTGIITSAIQMFMKSRG